MLHIKNITPRPLVLITSLCLVLANTCFASEVNEVGTAPKVDVVIALDVSGSMSGLISSAQQRLWDIVNQLGRAQPQPELRIAILSYGNPEYGAQSGFVNIDQAFTTDLDAVNQTLFGFSTNGGDEFVARAISTSVEKLDWSDDTNALRILFVAGNEEATQDPALSVFGATQMANARGIVVNTIYCGNDNDELAAGWRDVAAMTNGLYASIDQHSSAVANIATPMDQELATLNQALNQTYIAYGDSGDEHQVNQRDQDANAGTMSSAAAASRVVTKAGDFYKNAKWDLVDAIDAGTALEEIETEDLPRVMQSMDDAEREGYVVAQAEQREELKGEIQKLGKDRQIFIEDQRKTLPADTPRGLDEAIQEGLKAQAEKKGFTFEEG